MRVRSWHGPGLSFELAEAGVRPQHSPSVRSSWIVEQGLVAEPVVDDGMGTCTVAHDVVPRIPPLASPRPVQQQQHEELWMEFDVAEQIVESAVIHHGKWKKLQITPWKPVSCGAPAPVTEHVVPAPVVALTAPVTENVAPAAGADHSSCATDQKRNLGSDSACASRARKTPSWSRSWPPCHRSWTEPWKQLSVCWAPAPVTEFSCTPAVFHVQAAVMEFSPAQVVSQAPAPITWHWHLVSPAQCQRLNAWVLRAEMARHARPRLSSVDWENRWNSWRIRGAGFRSHRITHLRRVWRHNERSGNACSLPEEHDRDARAQTSHLTAVCRQLTIFVKHGLLMSAWREQHKHISASMLASSKKRLQRRTVAQPTTSDNGGRSNFN